jgi:hypothetical protein
LSRLGRSQPVQPTAWHGWVDPGPGPVGTTPRRPLVVENDDRRRRTHPLPPVIINGAYALTIAPVVLPVPPVVVQPPDRPRTVVAQPTATHGFAEIAPPRPLVVPQPDRRAAPPPSLAAHGFVVATTFNDSGTGTVTLSGVSAESQTHASAATATVTLDGTGSELFVPASAGPPDSPRHTVHIISHI